MSVRLVSSMVSIPPDMALTSSADSRDDEVFIDPRDYWALDEADPIVTISGTQNVKEYVHQMLSGKSSNLVGPKDFPRFLKIVTTSGETIKGQVTHYDYGFINIRSPIRKYSDPSARQKNSHSISIDTIASIISLNTSYAPKLAYEWNHKSSDDPWLVEIIKYADPRKLIGKLTHASEESVGNGYLLPICFTVKTDPDKNFITTTVTIENLIYIRKLPYTEQSIHSLDQKRIQIMKEALGISKPSALVALMAEYLAGDIPDELPKKWYDYLIAQHKRVLTLSCS